MPSTLKNNAYHILGLDTSAGEKDILKRSKEVINRLKANDSPDYDLDIGMFKDFRTEDAVKNALQRLQAPKKRIREYFFWIQIADSIDEQVLGLFKQKDYLNAIRIWENVSEGQSTKAFFYKKNLAILYCLVLSTEDNEDYLRSSLIAWKELIDSDRFWSSFSKVYKLHDEQTASEDIVSDFKKHVVEYLSDIYTELHHIHKRGDYINEFQRIFSVKGEKIEKSILGPAYQAINRSVEGLEKMEVSKDGLFDKEESETIKKLVASVSQELNKLIDLGLYEDSQTKIMRDRAANALRTVVLDLHNNLSELDKSKGLLEAAVQLAGTESLKNKLKDELEQINKNISDDAENSLVIDIPGYDRVPVVFKNKYIQHGNKRIYFRDATNIYYHATKHSTTVYGLPVSSSYTYSWSVASENENISFTFYANHDESQEKNIWARLAGAAGNLIEPHIVKKIVDQIFDRGETVRFGEVEFTKQGYSRMKSHLFRKNEKLVVNWADKIYIPKFDAGAVVLWKDTNGKNEQFARIEMATSNAVVLPELVQACYNRAT